LNIETTVKDFVARMSSSNETQQFLIANGLSPATDGELLAKMASVDFAVFKTLTNQQLIDEGIVGFQQAKILKLIALASNAPQIVSSAPQIVAPSVSSRSSLASPLPPSYSSAVSMSEAPAVSPEDSNPSVISADGVPVSLQLVLDVSGSMAGVKLQRVQAGVRSIVSQLRPGVDALSISKFTNLCTSITRRDDSFADMLRATDALDADGGTSLYDAIIQTVQEVKAWSLEQPPAVASASDPALDEPSDGPSAKRARVEDASGAAARPAASRRFGLIVLTDGEDAGGSSTLEQAKMAIAEPGIANFFFTIMLVNVSANVKELMSSMCVFSHTKILDVTTKSSQGRGIDSAFTAVITRSMRPDLACFDTSSGSVLRSSVPPAEDDDDGQYQALSPLMSAVHSDEEDGNDPASSILSFAVASTPDPDGDHLDASTPDGYNPDASSFP
jgi:hypothetical protein